MVTIESLQESLYKNYGECPVFFIGSLKDACQEAFGLPQLAEVCREFFF